MNSDDCWMLADRSADGSQVLQAIFLFISSHNYVIILLLYLTSVSLGLSVRTIDSQVPDPVKFPHGFKAVADFIHGLGMKSGLYTAKG